MLLLICLFAAAIVVWDDFMSLSSVGMDLMLAALHTDVCEVVCRRLFRQSAVGPLLGQLRVSVALVVVLEDRLPTASSVWC